MPIFFYFVFYIMNINIYNLIYICTLACIWALFLRINLFVCVFDTLVKMETEYGFESGKFACNKQLCKISEYNIYPTPTFSKECF